MTTYPDTSGGMRASRSRSSRFRYFSSGIFTTSGCTGSPLFYLLATSTTDCLIPPTMKTSTVVLAVSHLDTCIRSSTHGKKQENPTAGQTRTNYRQPEDRALLTRHLILSAPCTSMPLCVCEQLSLSLSLCACPANHLTRVLSLSDPAHSLPFLSLSPILP